MMAADWCMASSGRYVAPIIWHPIIGYHYITPTHGDPTEIKKLSASDAKVIACIC